MGENIARGEGESVARDHLEECFMEVFMALLHSSPARFTGEEELGRKNGVPIHAAMPNMRRKDFTFEEVCEKAGDIAKQLRITGDVFFEASDAYYAPQDEEDGGYYPPEVTIFMARDGADFACMLNIMPDGTVISTVHNEDSEFDAEEAYEPHAEGLTISTNEAQLFRGLAMALFQQTMSLAPPNS